MATKRSNHGTRNSGTTALTRGARRAGIGQTVSQAMKSLSAKRVMDWTKESPEISVAEAALNEAMAAYVDEKATREEVKKAYKVWADLHVGERGT